MAKGRKRTIDGRRDFDDLGDLAPWIREVRLAFWANADCYGHAPADPKWIIARAYARVAPKDLPDIAAALAELEQRGLVRLYPDSRGERYLELAGWEKVNHPGKALYPGPEETAVETKDEFARVWTQCLILWREAYGHDYVEEQGDRRQFGVFLRRLPSPEIAEQIPDAFRAYVKDKSDGHLVRRCHPMAWFFTRGFNRYRELARKEQERATQRERNGRSLEAARNRMPPWFRVAAGTGGNPR